MAHSRRGVWTAREKVLALAGPLVTLPAFVVSVPDSRFVPDAEVPGGNQ